MVLKSIKAQLGRIHKKLFVKVPRTFRDFAFHFGQSEQNFQFKHNSIGLGTPNLMKVCFGIKEDLKQT